MLTGLLWFDNDPRRELAAKITDAARRYQDKFGEAPNACYVNPAAAEGVDGAVLWQGGSLRVVPSGRIVAHHFWVGVETAGSG